MPWQTLCINAESKISLDQNNIVIKKADGTYQSYNLRAIDCVIFNNARLTITLPIITALIEHNTTSIFCNNKHDPIGMFVPFGIHTKAYEKLNEQINWNNVRKKNLWKMIIEQKICSEKTTIRFLKEDVEIINKLDTLQHSVNSNDKTNREAIAARIYFSNLFGEGFTRNRDCPVNYALNYGYKILASYISSCITGRGLLPALGIHHIGPENAFNLTYDFIEAFRYIIDIWTYLYIYSMDDDAFLSGHRQQLNQIFNTKIRLDDTWMRLDDGISKIVDSYISYLNDDRDTILHISYKDGIQLNE